MLEVRAARHGDAPALDALGAAPEAGVFVLEKNGAVIGALTLRAGEIFGCAVAPEWRGRGYGTFLLRRALRAAGPGPVYTQTPPGNAAMEALLRRCGFRPQEQALPAAGEEPARAREAGAAAGPLSLPQKWVRGVPDGDGENALAVAHAFLRTHVRPGAFALDETAFDASAESSVASAEPSPSTARAEGSSVDAMTAPSTTSSPAAINTGPHTNAISTAKVDSSRPRARLLMGIPLSIAENQFEHLETFYYLFGQICPNRSMV